ncbi:MAG: hypothetical protein IKE60_16070 [Reyranella sp.]|uniref:Lipoprotein n=1 Tax=Bosea vestrisii TaxID=151416 RepID=A0ABW0HH02_9HYPH|nr:MULTISPECIES: hypothetical protein [Hyphomicrobiales]MBR2816169.1 hypothetical protein [Reyranella sp.]MBR3193161.1 hypothetical protein [Bosea sp. (in: a-proteobacteria)]
MIDRSAGRVGRFALPAALALALAGCGSSGSSGTGEPSSAQKLGNILMFQSTTPPPVDQLPQDDEANFICPQVIISDGGAAIRAQAGPDSGSLRSQVSINTVARECTPVGKDGAFTLKVGVEGRILIGPAGSPGSYGATLITQVIRNNQVIARRSARVGGAIPSGQTGADFSHVESNISVPAGSGEVEIIVGLSPGGGEPARRRRR